MLLRRAGYDFDVNDAAAVAVTDENVDDNNDDDEVDDGDFMSTMECAVTH